LQLSACEHMVILLTDDMWTRQGASEAFAHEVCEAMRHGVHRLLVHEVPGARIGDNEDRHACSFEQIIATSPKHVCQAQLYNEIAQNVVGGTLRAAGLAKTAMKLAGGSGSRSEWTYEPEEPEPDVVEVIVASGPLGIDLMQRSSHIVVSRVEPASIAAAQRVTVGSVLDAVNGQAVGNMEEGAVVDMINGRARPWRLLLRVAPPLDKQPPQHAVVSELSQSNDHASTSAARSLTSRMSKYTHALGAAWVTRMPASSSSIAPVSAEAAQVEIVSQPVTLLATQRTHELAPSQPELAGHEIALAQLCGEPIDLGPSRRDLRRISSGLSAASSIARRYQPMDDDFEAARYEP